MCGPVLETAELICINASSVVAQGPFATAAEGTGAVVRQCPSPAVPRCPLQWPWPPSACRPRRWRRRGQGRWWWCHPVSPWWWCCRWPACLPGKCSPATHSSSWGREGAQSCPSLIPSAPLAGIQQLWPSRHTYLLTEQNMALSGRGDASLIPEPTTPCYPKKQHNRLSMHVSNTEVNGT